MTAVMMEDLTEFYLEKNSAKKLVDRLVDLLVVLVCRSSEMLFVQKSEMKLLINCQHLTRTFSINL